MSYNSCGIYNAGVLSTHPECKAECETLVAMKDSEYAKLKLECKLATKRLKDLEEENKALSRELRQAKRLACTLQCEVQSLVEKCTADLTSTYPYMDEPATYISQSLQPRNNETMLAELLRVEKAICARYKAKADTVDRLEKELAACKAQCSTSRRHDMVFNFNVQAKRDPPPPAEPLTDAELQESHHPSPTSASAQELAGTDPVANPRWRHGCPCG